MATAMDVARFLIRLAVTGDEPDPLTHLRLQKLLYYVQAWHLAAFGKPMFRERIEAWANGPVVAEVWPHFKAHGFTSILPEETELSSDLNRDQQAFIKSIWDKYNLYSAIQLSRMTHNESPWLSARNGLPDGVRSSQEITHESMRAFFGPRIAAMLPKGISLGQLTQADADIDRGRFATHEEMRVRLIRKTGKGNGL